MHRRRFLRVATAGVGSLIVERALGPSRLVDLRGAVLTASPAVTPFASALRIPALAVPTSTDGGVDRYDIEMREATVEILPGMATTIWGYDGLFPGPTIAARAGRPVTVTFHNALDVDTAIHLHGGHVPPEMDGHPMDFIAPGASRQYDYPNAQPHSSLWYHDHAMEHTSENIYRGLAGLYLLRDDIDTGLGLPDGDRDIPLVLQDRTFNADGSLYYPPPGDQRRHDGVTGDVFLVNGVPVPHLEVERAPYRFRVVNASNSRPYELSLAGRPLTQIASDGGLLAAPVTMPTITLGIAERAEVVIDFSAIDAGAEVELQDVITGQPLMRFDVSGSSSGGSPLPTVLRTFPTPTPPAVGSSRVDLQACKLEYSIVSPK